MKNEPTQTIQIISSIRECANKSLNTFIMFHTQDIFEAWLKIQTEKAVHSTEYFVSLVERIWSAIL